jgi:hypothetical protein
MVIFCEYEWDELESVIDIKIKVPGVMMTNVDIICLNLLKNFIYSGTDIYFKLNCTPYLSEFFFSHEIKSNSAKVKVMEGEGIVVVVLEKV